MKLEIFGSLFAMLLSLFVTLDGLSLRATEESEAIPLFDNRIASSSDSYRSPRNDNRQNFPFINAQSVFVGCLCDEPPLYALNSSAQLPLASITKIMTTYLALRELGPDYLVTVSDEAIATEGIAGGLQAGEQLSVKDLITMAMTYSSNDAAVALAEALGRAQGLPAASPTESFWRGQAGARTFSDAVARAVFSMNEEAFTLGMRHTFFQNPTGLDFEYGPSNFSTAEDWVLLLQATLAHPLLWDLTRDETPRVISKNGTVHELLNLNPFRSFPHYIGGKTGTTDSAGENFVMLFEKPLGKLEALILFGSPPGAREAEAKKLLDWVASF